MPSDYKIAGQSKPAADVDQELYVVPSGKKFVASTITLCNQSTSGVIEAYYIAIVKSGESLADKHWIKYNEPLGPRASKQFTLGITIAVGDKIIVKSDLGYISFSLFGAEIS